MLNNSIDWWFWSWFVFMPIKKTVNNVKSLIFTTGWKWMHYRSMSVIDHRYYPIVYITNVPEPKSTIKQDVTCNLSFYPCEEFKCVRDGKCKHEEFQICYQQPTSKPFKKTFVSNVQAKCWSSSLFCVGNHHKWSNNIEAYGLFTHCVGCHSWAMFRVFLSCLFYQLYIFTLSFYLV